MYKFARMYTIEWLVADMIVRLIAMPIKPDNFYEMYQFAIGSGLKDLHSRCLESVDSDVVDALIESGNLAKMDAGSVEKFTNLKPSQLPEIKVFANLRDKVSSSARVEVRVVITGSFFTFISSRCFR